MGEQLALMEDEVPTQRAPVVGKQGGRGFARMPPELVREIASKGGRAAHANGTAHRWTSEEATAAGRKGGMAARRRVVK